MRKPKAIHLRRFSQLAFLLIFITLFLQVKDPLNSILPPDLLLRLDPLAGIISSVAQRQIIVKFLPSLFVILLTIVLSRSFCGWVCPLGTILDIWNRIFPSDKDGGDRRWKYALLFGLIFLTGFKIL